MSRRMNRNPARPLRSPKSQFAIRNALHAFDNAFDMAIESIFDLDYLLPESMSKSSSREIKPTSETGPLPEQLSRQLSMTLPHNDTTPALPATEKKTPQFTQLRQMACTKQPLNSSASTQSTPHSVTNQLSQAVRGLADRLVSESRARHTLASHTPHTAYPEVPAALITARQRRDCVNYADRADARCEAPTKTQLNARFSNTHTNTHASLNVHGHRLLCAHNSHSGNGPGNGPGNSLGNNHSDTANSENDYESEDVTEEAHATQDEVDPVELHEQLARRNDIWRGSRRYRPGHGSSRKASVSTGYAPLDELLATEGWPVGAITEIHCDTDGAAALSLALPALAQLSGGSARERTSDNGSHATSKATGDKWIVWVSPPHVPYAPALKAAGVNLDHMLIVHRRQQQPRADDSDNGIRSREMSSNDMVWAVEQALRSGTASIVLAWFDQIGAGAMRRLQLAAEAGNTTALVFRPEHTAGQNSPAALRLRVRTCRSQSGSISKDPRVDIEVIRQRGAWSRGSTRLTLDQHTVDNAERVRHSQRRTARHH